ncbi:hypothetical protein CONCODRAFT_78894 [Conidiobolus coronatus NRRL 28638]|uniref:Transmembrane protein 198 n=1 Tax=Conidiobolus coronatus (strain ATCC 28846 / CBS 209.66 / NRRL 28638) TaxID=796925 RepID=A0A137P5Y5_CONC2|nr:hypothetical protein CONCODRAFT_78894 [Conidiobolus coronatus NRRL 28638]|eukprot:KXN70341.1 hypothetical protein CONCODRAFT_78894 [Conidiobolus coronatus NRRL 28638]
MNQFISILSLLAIFISGVTAQDYSFQENGGAPNTDAASIIIGIIAMVLGLIFVFAGKRVIKFLLFISGCIFFAGLTIIISGKIVDLNNITSTQRIIIIVFTVLIGLLGGLLSWYLYKLGIAIIGFLAGFNIGGLIVNGISSLDDNYWGRLGIMVACGLVIAILTLFLMNIMIVVATAFVGSQGFMIGIDFIANKGYVNFVKVTSSLKSFKLTPTLWAMLGSSIVLTLIGTLVQFKLSASKRNQAQYQNLELQSK